MRVFKNRVNERVVSDSRLLASAFRVVSGKDPCLVALRSQECCYTFGSNVSVTES